jgi:DUF1680 family protein
VVDHVTGEVFLFHNRIERLPENTTCSADFGTLYVISSTDGGATWGERRSLVTVLHQYATSSLSAGEFTVDVETGYPWDGQVTVTVRQAPAGEVELALRVPDWAAGSTVDGNPVPAGTYARLRKIFRAGERLVLNLPMPPRLLVPGEHLDAVRGCVAVARGPLVYAVEQPDQPPGVTLEDIRIDPTVPPRAEHRPDLLGGVTVLHASGAVTTQPVDAPYRPYGEPVPPVRRTPITLIPYHAWANRGPHPMRVWIPATNSPA